MGYGPIAVYGTHADNYSPYHLLGTHQLAFVSVPSSLDYIILLDPNSNPVS